MPCPWTAALLLSLPLLSLSQAPNHAISKLGLSTVTETLEGDCRSDWLYSNGASETADPIHSIRSGAKGQHTSAAPARQLVPGTTVTALELQYRYNTGYGPTGVGSNFTVLVAGIPVYTSPYLTNYSYDANRSQYSPPVQVSLTNLSVAIPLNASKPSFIALDFANNDRNVQLMLPLQFTVTCLGGEACLAPPEWEPPVRNVVFRGGEPDESGAVCPCFRIPALAVVRSRLVAFAEARFHGCSPDVHPQTAIAVRYSLDGLVGKRWSPIHIVAQSLSKTGLNYPTPVVDEQKGVVHLFYNEAEVGEWHTSSSDGGETWTVPARAQGAVSKLVGGGGGGVQLPDGRMLVVCNGKSSLAACYSDDHGTTWQVGADVPSSLALGETSIVPDGHGPRTLTLFSRAGYSHALSTSDDGGETWTAAVSLPSLVGPSCQGSVGASPGQEGKVLLSAPYSRDGGLSGRENLSLWEVDPRAATTSSRSMPQPTRVGRLWGCKGAYTAFSPDGTMNLFEAGETFRYETIMLAHLNSSQI